MGGCIAAVGASSLIGAGGASAFLLSCRAHHQHGVQVLPALFLDHSSLVRRVGAGDGPPYDALCVALGTSCQGHAPLCTTHRQNTCTALLGYVAFTQLHIQSNLIVQNHRNRTIIFLLSCACSKQVRFPNTAGVKKIIMISVYQKICLSIIMDGLGQRSSKTIKGVDCILQNCDVCVCVIVYDNYHKFIMALNFRK
jgi:hypothetical protein